MKSNSSISEVRWGSESRAKGTPQALAPVTGVILWLVAAKVDLGSRLWGMDTCLSGLCGPILRRMPLSEQRVERRQHDCDFHVRVISKMKADHMNTSEKYRVNNWALEGATKKRASSKKNTIDIGHVWSIAKVRYTPIRRFSLHCP